MVIHCRETKTSFQIDCKYFKKLLWNFKNKKFNEIL